MENVVITAAYEATALIFVYGLTQRVGTPKMTANEFEWRFFLKLSFFYAASVQIGFVVLTSVLYHNQESVAVGLAALPGILGFFIILMVVQAAFFRRYCCVPNLIRRLERMTPDEREKLLSQLPARTFSQLPGDYRFVSHRFQSNR